MKTRMQWGWFKAALIGVAVAILIAPSTGGKLGIVPNEKEEEAFSISELIGNISFGSKTKIIINGEVVALAKSEEAAKEAYKAARLSYNAKGVQIVNADVSYAEFDKEKDAQELKGMRVLKNEKLEAALLESLPTYSNSDKELAYTMRVDDYTVTVGSMEDLVSMLEQAQAKYDTNDDFRVELNAPASHNIRMYEVGVEEKAASEALEGNQAKGAEKPIAPRKMALTGESSSEASAENSEATTAEGEAEGETTEAATTENSTEEQATEEQSQEVLAQAANDGIKYVGFAENIQVTETYVSKQQIKDKDTAYAEITAENEEASIYVVAPGDCLSIIAEKNNMTIDKLKELNPTIESDDNLYYDDRLNITVPEAAVQILVQKQETYEEQYNEDVVYEDDGNMYIGETEVVQEGNAGTHTVTDLVTYTNDLETGREQLQETVEVAAVAQIVKRGTKSKPTYMYPVTNWAVTSVFGYRWGRLHAGIDVGVPVGTTVRASRGGQVLTAGWVGGYGNCVIVDHGDGIVSYYGHLSQFTVSAGQYVDQGDQIALSGNTGRSTGPHLHFEIRVNGSSVDPAPYLAGSN